MKVRNVEAPATALMSTMLAHDTVEPALDAASQRKVGAVDGQDQTAIQHACVKPVGQDEFDANGAATVVECFPPFVDPGETVTAALVLLAISFIFGPLRSVTLGQRVFTGVLVGFTFRIVQDLLGPSSLVFGFSPLFAVLVPTAICAVAGFWLLRRAG